MDDISLITEEDTDSQPPNERIFKFLMLENIGSSDDWKTAVVITNSSKLGNDSNIEKSAS
jgi:hypothetical protein